MKAGAREGRILAPGLALVHINRKGLLLAVAAIPSASALPLWLRWLLLLLRSLSVTQQSPHTGAPCPAAWSSPWLAAGKIPASDITHPTSGLLAVIREATADGEESSTFRLQR